MSIGKVVKVISRELAPGIVVYSNVIDQHQTLIPYIENSAASGSLEWQKAYVRSSGADEVDTNTRDTLTIGVPYLNNLELNLLDENQSATKRLSQIFFNAFDPIENDYKNNFSLSTESHDVYGILKYGVGQKFTNHIDDHLAYPRRLSSVYYINDDYDGGEINFPRFGLSYKPLANEMLLFPSIYVYNHSVSEVTSGTRYAVVSWMR
jgi:hypothetical protein